MGYGKKLDFTTKINRNPPPNAYTIKNYSIAFNSEKKRKITFGESRNKCKLIGIKDDKYEKIFPGPGAYTLPSSFKGNRAASFRIKTGIL